MYYPSESLTNAYILSAILPIKATVDNRPDTSCRHVVANRISVMTEISKDRQIEANIVQIDTVIGQCPYQPTKINYINRYLDTIPKCSQYFLSRLCNFSLWNYQSQNIKIHILLTHCLLIKLILQSWPRPGIIYVMTLLN